MKSTNLSNFADIIMGQSPPSASYNTEGNGLPFFQGKAEFGETYPRIKKWCDSPTRIAKRGDILMSVRAPVGPTNICPEKACIGRGLAAIRPKKNKSDTFFLLYYFRFIENQVAERGKGSTFASINREDVETIKIPEIDYDKQRFIAQLLSQAKSALEKRRQTLRLADEFLQSAFLEMFGDPAKNPKKLDVVPCGTIALLVSSGSTPLGGEKTYLREGIFFIRSQNVLMNKLDLSDVAYISDEVHHKMKRTWVKKDDVLLNITGASIGRVAFFEGEDNTANVNQHVCIIRPDKNKVLPQYLSFLISMPNYQKTILGKNAGATRQAFNFDQIKRFHIPLALISEQQKFADLVQKVKKLKEKQKQSETQLQNLFNSLMQRAFKGEIV